MTQGNDTIVSFILRLKDIFCVRTPIHQEIICYDACLRYTVQYGKTTDELVKVVDYIQFAVLFMNDNGLDSQFNSDIRTAFGAL